MINREKIYELVEVFYQPTFKTFYVNSIDGKNFVKPVGVFVSLGITTSLKVLEDIKNVISGTKGYNARIAEISSRKISGQFLNTLENNESPKQYKISEDADVSKFLNKEKSEKRLQEMKNLMNQEQKIDSLKQYAPKISKLQDLIDKLNSSGWEDHLIEETGDDFRIYHLNVNYKKVGDVEYRIGIFVSEDK